MAKRLELLRIVIDEKGSIIVQETDLMHQKPLAERVAALRGFGDELHLLAMELETNGPGH